MQNTNIKRTLMMISLFSGVLLNLICWQQGAWAKEPSAPFQTTTWHVTNTNDHGPGTLRQAIADAAAGDTIDFQLVNCPCTITLNGASLSIFKGLTITGPGAEQLTISGNDMSRIFYISYGTTVTLSGMTLTKGWNYDPIGGGGAIYASGSTLNLNSVVLSSNRAATLGGGIALLDGGATTITNCVISGNQASYGGGIFQETGTLTVIGSTISGNIAMGDQTAGGIANQDVLNIVNSTISGNAVPNSTIGGGGILQVGAATITNSTITNNSSKGGASGVFSDNSSTIIRNTIIAGNVNNALIPDVVGAFTSTGYNLIGNIGTVTNFIAPGDQKGNAAAPLDPRLGPLQNNGGATPTHFPLPESPVLDKGNRFGINTDQRGQPRPFDQPTIANAGDGSDIGAVESQVVCPALSLTPSTLANGTVGTAYNATLTPSLTNRAYYFSVSGLPAGLTANLTKTNVTISGTPAQAGNFTVRVTVTSSNGCAYGESVFALVIAKGTPVITWTPPAFLNAYTTLSTADLNATANVPGAFYYMPPVGTYLTPGTINLTAIFAPLDANNYNSTGRSVSVPVLNSCGITINPTALPAMTHGIAFTQTLTAAPSDLYTFGLLAGTLPPGMQLMNTFGAAVLSGTPTAAGTYSFTLKVKSNFTACEAARTYTVVVR